MKKFLKKMLPMFLVIMIFSTNIFARANDIDIADNFINKVFENGNAFFKPSEAENNSSGTVGASLSDIIKSGGTIDVIGIIFDIGNLIIFIIVIILGIKYIFAGIGGKADIKEGLPNLVFGILFFYAADTMYKVFANFMMNNSSSYDTFTKSIYGTVTMVANVCAILGITLVGLKYMLTSADSKADVKKQLLPVVIGIIMVYCTSKVIMLIYNMSSMITTT